MPKVDVGFRFSEEVDARLKELAAAYDTTRTVVLEGLVMEASDTLRAQKEGSVNEQRDVPAEPEVLPRAKFTPVKKQPLGGPDPEKMAKFKLPSSRRKP